MGDVRKCRKCGKTNGLKPYTMTSGAETFFALLCPDCGKPIDELMAIGTTKPEPLPPATPKGSTHRIVPVD